MGLDQYAGFRDSNGEVNDTFYWRKHARLQQFFAEKYNEQKPEEHDTDSMLSHLGFNGGQGGVKITEDIIKELEKEIKNGYPNYFASDGFFWGQQFQEESVKEYEDQDKKFIDWCKEKLKEGKEIGYDCSW